MSVGRSGGTPRALVIDFGGPDAPVGLPWVGLHEERRMVQLDPDDGSELRSVPTGVSPYGAALDPSGSIWISGFMESAIQRLDPLTYTTDASISATSGGCSGPYGIATDSWGRVWFGSFAASACRYDPSDRSFLMVPLTDASVSSRGVAVDADDVVWVAAHSWSDGYLFGFRAEDGSDMRSYSTLGRTPVGVAVDSLGFIWAVNQETSTASRLDPTRDSVEVFPVGRDPYTYSDFTGFQRARVWSSGRWSRVFERCADLPLETAAAWANPAFDLRAPSSTSVEVQARTAETRTALAAAPLLTLATVPGTVSPVDIEAAFSGAGYGTGRFLEVVVTLRSSGGAASPVLESLEVGWRCEGPVG